MITRRSFLLGAADLLTTAFVTRVQRHVQETARPLLVDPGSADETLYLYNQQSWSDRNKWRLSLGPYDGDTEPPPPTWREHLMARHRLESTDDVEAVCHVMGAIAQFERKMMLERQREGIAKAKAEGRYKGRKPTARAKTNEIKALSAQGVSLSEIARRLNVGKASVHRALRADVLGATGSTGP